MTNANIKKFEVFDASEYRVAIIRACYNDDITQKMTDESVSTLHEYGVLDEQISLFEVPGCVEIPVIADALAQTDDYDAIIAIGCVIKGETPHFDFVCKLVTEGVLRISLDHTIPIGFGVITVNTADQANNRIYMGKDATIAALQSAKIILEL
jgi:6,7-dimethyl-8-ribityllumazine synthase